MKIRTGPGYRLIEAAAALVPERPFERLDRKIAPVLAFLGLVSDDDRRFWAGESTR
jgi:hypothetical protein